MISEERLKELIEQEKDVWVNGENDISVGCVHLNKKYQPELYRNGLSNYILYIYTNDKFEYKEEIFDNELYETKEEAEFVLKFHCSNTIKFEPVPFESICNNERVNYNGIYDCWWRNLLSFGIQIELFIFHKKAAFKVNGKEFNAVDFEDKQAFRQAYYQAVEYAKKLFLGEEE